MNYSDEVKDRLSKILLVLLDLLTSKKFLAAMAGGITGWYQTGDVKYFAGAMIAYLLAQGVADYGKGAALVNAVAGQMPKPAPLSPAPPNPAPAGRPVASVFPGSVAELLTAAGYPTIESLEGVTEEELIRGGAAFGLTPANVQAVFGWLKGK